MDEVNLPDELMEEHSRWHDRGNIEGTRMGDAGDVGSGIDFLGFHRQFIRKVVTWYLEENGSLPYWWRGWNAIPDELKVGFVDQFDNYNWEVYEPAEQRIVNNPLSFASADELGIFIETGKYPNPNPRLTYGSIHDYVHFKSAWVYRDDKWMPNISVSTKSPLFYLFHGLIGRWWERWANATYAWPRPYPCDRIRRAIASLKMEIESLQTELQTAIPQSKPSINARIREAQEQLPRRERELKNCIKRGDGAPDLNIETFQPALNGLTEVMTRIRSDKNFANELFAAVSAMDKVAVERLCQETGAYARFEERQEGVMLVPPAKHVCLLIEGHVVAFPIDKKTGTFGSAQVDGLPSAFGNKQLTDTKQSKARQKKSSKGSMKKSGSDPTSRSAK